MTEAEPSPPPGGLASSAVPPVPITWPDGVTAAACLTFDMDAEAPILTEDISAISRMTPMSHQSYGPLVGVPRILEMLARHEIKATFFIPGYSAHRYPDVVRAVAEAGHEIAHHSYFHENTIGMDAETEAAMLDLGLRALREVAGVRPEGYRAPMWELTYNTPRLLAERGFLWDSSLMDSDHPYVLAVDGAPRGAARHAGRGPGVVGPRRLGAVRVPARPDRSRRHREPGQGARDVDARARGDAPARRGVRAVLSPLPVRTAVPGRGPGAADRADEVPATGCGSPRWARWPGTRPRWACLPAPARSPSCPRTPTGSPARLADVALRPERTP